MSLYCKYSTKSAGRKNRTGRIKIRIMNLFTLFPIMSSAEKKKFPIRLRNPTGLCKFTIIRRSSPSLFGLYDTSVAGNKQTTQGPIYENMATKQKMAHQSKDCVHPSAVNSFI